jgi:hypothetical protein
MKKLNNIDVDILDNIIIGRVEPKIYAFTTETVPNYTKIGDTYRPIEIRLNEWRKYFPNLEKVMDRVAKVNDEIFFRDHSIHHFLENEAQKERLRPGNIQDIPYYSKEFFKNTSEVDIDNALKDIKKSYESNNNAYQYYKFEDSHIPIIHNYKRLESYKPRPNQKDTIVRFKEAVGKGRNNLLMYAVMRFGKSFTSMCCATEMDANVVLIVSAKADVKEEWKKTVESHKRFAEYSFFDSNSLLKNNKLITEKKKSNEKIVFFLTLQDLQGDSIKSKHKELFGNKIDLLIIDETHFGARAAEYGKVLKENHLSDQQIDNELKLNDNTLEDLDISTKTIDAKVRLHLSGTPYRILMNSEFTDEDIIAFYQFSDIVDDQEEWDKINLQKDEITEWDNPYYGFPQMIRFAFNPNKSSIKKMEEIKRKGITYAFSALFRPMSIGKDNENNLHKQFQHEQEIIDLLNVIDGSKNDENILSFLDYDKLKDGKMCRHIVCVLPYRASCDALEELIKNNSFKNIGDYEMINISGLDGGKVYKNTQSIQRKIKKCEAENKKTITLTVNRMLTGSTVPEWDTMLYFKDTASPQEYDQAIFRLQNQYIRVYEEPNGDIVKFNMKPQTLLVDFNPSRMFQMQEHKSQIYNVNIESNGNSKLENRIKKELKISPIIVLNNKKIRQIQPADILDAVREYSSNRSVIDEANSISIDLSLLDIDEIRAEIEKQGKIGSKQGLQIKASDGDGDEIDVEDESDKEEILDDGEKEINIPDEELKDDYRDQFAMYYARILFFAFLTDARVKSLQEIINEIEKDKNNLRIIENIGINKNTLVLFQNNINPFVLSELDYKIHNINYLANDPDIEPIQRAGNAMKKFSRLSGSEIVTPEIIANKIINDLPENAINTNTKILDIASKQGEFAYAINKKFGKKISNNFYSIPTSKIAYEFTMKVYKLLEIDVNLIENNYTTYDILEKKDLIYDDNIKINNNNMKFDVIVGNPPYQKNIGGKTNKSLSKQLYPAFIMLMIKMQPEYLSFITPSRWFAGNGQDRSFVKLRNFMRSNNHISNITNYLDSNDVFEGINLTGGVNYFLYKKGYFGDISFKEISNSNTTVIKRPLFEQGLNTILPMNSMVSISRKVTAGDFKSIVSIVTGRNPFGLPPKESDLSNISSDTQNSTYNTLTLCAYEKIRYIAKAKITRKEELSQNWKVFTSKMNGGAGTLLDGKPVSILGKTFLMGPGTVCSNALIAVGNFKKKDEASNLNKYMNTKFFRFMLGMMKISQVLTSNIYKFVPLQDFSSKSDIDWQTSIEEIDKQLYEKYKLTKKEIDYIESKIKLTT